MNILVVDAFDSFVYTLRQYLLVAGAEPQVVRSDELTPAAVAGARPDAILLGPGPGHPSVSGHVEIVQELGAQVPILGVCLGHQAIGLAFGADVVPAHHLMHGKTSRVVHDGTGLFDGVAEDFTAARYHSLVVVERTVPECLEISAWSADDRYVMALRHRELPIESVQFHPESIRTSDGMRLIRNFLDAAAAFDSWRPARPAVTPVHRRALLSG